MAVEGYTTDERGIELDIVLETAPEVPAPRRTDSVDPRKPMGGFTYEEELFRLKWGWAAFDKARRVALGMDGGAAGNAREPR